MKDSELSEVPLEKGHVEEEDPEDTSCSGKLRKMLAENVFLVVNIVGIVIGFLVGMLVRSTDIGEDGILWLGMPGELYMRILKCVIIPLIVCTVIDGTANTDPKTNGKLGAVSLGYIIVSNTLSAALGLIICLIVRPGAGVEREESLRGVDTKNLRTVDIFADFIRNLFPPNMVGAVLEVSQTQYKAKSVVNEVNISGQLVNETSAVMARSLGTVSSTNILGLIVISAALGIAASQSGPQAKPFLAFFKSGAAIIFKLFNWIKWTTPVGSASLIASALANIKELGPALRSIGVFTTMVVVSNILVLQFLIMSAVFVAVRRRNPLKFFMNSARAWFMAFGAQNSTIPYPEYLRILTGYGVDRRVSEYLLPFCVTLNRSGSAFFLTATSVFVIQYTGTSIATGAYFTVLVLGVLSSLAIPAVNSSSIVSIVIIVESLGVATGGTVGLIMAMEWLNDRIRSVTNGIGHLTCVLTTWRLCRKSFKAMANSEDSAENMLTKL